MKSLLTSFCILVLAINLNAQNDIKLIPYKKGFKYGYCDQKKNIIIPIQYDNAYPFGYQTDSSYYEDLAFVQINNETYIINKKGEIVDKSKDFDKKSREEGFPPPQTEDIKTVNYDVFEENGLKGIKDEDGNIILKPLYGYLSTYKFSNSYQNPKTKKYYNPTYVSAKSKEKSIIIRLDKLTYYDKYSMRKFDANTDFMIIESNDKKQGLLFEKEVKLIDPKFTEILKYYPNQQILCVNKIVDDHPYDIYIDFDGNEYYE